MGTLDKALRKTRAQINDSDKTKRTAARLQRQYVEAARRQFETSLLGGTLAITAWSALYAAHAGDGFQISGFSLGLLFIGAFSLVAGPVIVKAEALFVSYMIRESAGHVGFSALFFSLCSIAWDISGRAGGIPMAALSFLVVIGDLKQDVTLIGFLRQGIPKMPSPYLFTP
ncbi:hypothetical protein GCM10009664_60790 [Kitasatospora gansuensis]